jgi:hypothetical protein
MSWHSYDTRSSSRYCSSPGQNRTDVLIVCACAKTRQRYTPDNLVIDAGEYCWQYIAVRSLEDKAVIDCVGKGMREDTVTEWVKYYSGSSQTGVSSQTDVKAWAVIGVALAAVTVVMQCL